MTEFRERLQTCHRRQIEIGVRSRSTTYTARTTLELAGREWDQTQGPTSRRTRPSNQAHQSTRLHATHACVYARVGYSLLGSPSGIKPSKRREWLCISGLKGSGSDGLAHVRRLFAFRCAAGVSTREKEKVGVQTLGNVVYIELRRSGGQGIDTPFF
jgi:hypothetical protein